MQSIDAEIKEIRERVIESERRKLMKKATMKFPKDKKRQEAYVYKTLNARYGQPRQTDLAEKKEVDEIHEIEIWFGFRADGFGRGDCLAEIMKRDVGKCGEF